MINPLRAKNPIRNLVFSKGDLVKLTREINGLKGSWTHERGAVGTVVQIVNISAVKVRFADGTEPMVATIYLTRNDG